MSCSIGTNTGCHDNELSIVDTSATRTRVGITVQPATSTVTGGGGGGGVEIEAVSKMREISHSHQSLQPTVALCNISP